ncbi:hypothetical protein ACWCRF_11615 [Streptomyces sp. NPDC002405]
MTVLLIIAALLMLFNGFASLVHSAVLWTVHRRVERLEETQQSDT